MATKPERFSEEWVALIEQGIPSYPGDLEVIDIVRSQGWEGFWEVSDDDVVDPKANRLKQDQEMEAQLRAQQDRMMGADNQALQFWQRRGGQNLQEAADDVVPYEVRRQHAIREGQMSAAEKYRQYQQAQGYGAYAPVPSTIPGADDLTLGDAQDISGQAALWSDPYSGLGPNTGYRAGELKRKQLYDRVQAEIAGAYDPSLRGVDQEAVAMAAEGGVGRRANVDTSSDWQNYGIDPNKDSTLEALLAKERGISLYPEGVYDPTKLAASISAAPQTQQFTPHLPAGWNQMFTPGQDMGLVDPNQPYPGSVRRGVAGPVTEGEKKKTSKIVETITQVDDPNVSDKRVIKIDHGDNLESFTRGSEPFEQFYPGEDRGLVDPTSAYPGSVRLGAPGAVTAGRQFPDTSGGDKPWWDIGNKLNLPSSPEELWKWGGLVGAPSAEEIAGFLGGKFGGKDTVADPSPQVAGVDISGVEAIEQAAGISDDDVVEERTQIRTPRGSRRLVAESTLPTEEQEDTPEVIYQPRAAGDRGPRRVQVDEASLLDEVGTTGGEGGLLGDDLRAQLEGEYGAAGEFSDVPQPTSAKYIMEDDPGDRFVPDENASTVSGGQEPNTVQSEELEREWGKYTWNPKERKEMYMTNLNSLFRKAAILDAIAALTGAPSQSEAYLSRAMMKMEAMLKFDQEERLYNIWRDVYFVDGKYDAPKSKRQAAERARRLGARPEEVSKIFGWTQEGEDLVQWYRVVDNKLETATTEGKKTRPAQGASKVKWIMGKPPANLHGTSAAPSTKKSIAPDGTLVWATDAQIQSGGYSPLPANDPRGAAWERVAAQAEKYLEEDNEDAAMAAWEMYYSSAKDPTTQEIFGAEAAVNQARLNIERSRRMLGLAGSVGPAPLTEEQKAANANASDQEKVARMTTLKREGLTQDQVRDRMLQEGYNL